MPTIMVRAGSRDNYLWDGTLKQLQYYVEDLWLKDAKPDDPLVLDFSRCRLGAKVSRYVYTLMQRGVLCINTRDMPGLPEMYNALQQAAKGSVNYHYVPIDIQTTYEGIVENAKRLKSFEKEYKPENYDGKTLCFYVREQDEFTYMNSNVIPANLAYYMLTRLSLNFDPFYNGRENSEKHEGPYNKFLLRNVFKFITDNVGVPPEFYEEGDKSIWVVNQDGLLQKLQYNKDGNLYKENGINMYYYPGFGWYTLNDIRRMGLYPLPGFLFISSIANRTGFVKSLQLACMKVKLPVSIAKQKAEGSKLLKFLETYHDHIQGEYNE